jgi:hypothetical protein
MRDLLFCISWYWWIIGAGVWLVLMFVAIALVSANSDLAEFEHQMVRGPDGRIHEVFVNKEFLRNQQVSRRRARG